MYSVGSYITIVLYLSLCSLSLSLQADHSVGGSWTVLYSSSKHGFSMNRFQHHCSDYKDPSVLLLTCHHDGEDRMYSFVVALDTDWR